MKAVTKLMAGAAGVAALVGMAAPAAAQYPGYYPGYNNNPANVIGQVIGQVLNPYGQYGYGQQYAYGANPQVAVQQCSAAVQQRLQSRYRPAGYGYSPYAYNNAYSQARVLGITRVERRSSTTTRVRGYATSGMMYGGYGGYGGYAQAQAPADLIFRCDVDYRGYVRDIDIDRRD